MVIRATNQSATTHLDRGGAAGRRAEDAQAGEQESAGLVQNPLFQRRSRLERKFLVPAGAGSRDPVVDSVLTADRARTAGRAGGRAGMGL